MRSYSEKRQKEQDDAKARCVEAHKAVVKQVRTLAKPLKVKSESNWSIDVGEQTVRVEISPESAASSWKASGKIRGKVGSYSDIRQFPQRKDYDSWINGMAEEVVERGARQTSAKISRERRDDATEKAQAQVTKLKKLAGAKSHGGGRENYYGGDFNVEPVIYEDPDKGVCEVTEVQLEANFYLNLPFKEAEAFIRGVAALRAKFKDTDYVD